MDDGVVNWGEHTVEEEESNNLLMEISSNNEVSLCSKTCIDSYNKLKTLCDEQTNQLGEQEAKILAYTLAVKKLEAQVVTFQKQQLSLNEQLTFQANEIYAKDEKLKKYRRIGMKAVKEKEQLQKTVDSWKNSSKNLWKLVDSGMTSTSKIGLGYEIQSNNEVLSYEEEMNRSVFKCTEEDYVGKPLYSRFSKTDNFKGVPHPLTGDYTPKPQEEIDDSLYVYGKKGPQKPEISDSADNSTEHSTCQSNDSEGSFGNPSEHSSESESESISVPNEMSTSKSVTANEKVVSESKEVEPSCVTHVKTPRKQMKNQETHEVKRKNWNEIMGRELGEGYSFIKKKCFVCGSLSHLIKDCDYYEKKMAREAELKKQRVFNTGNGVAKPVWNNAHRVNHANHFVPRPVQLNAVRQNVNSVRPNVNTGRVNVNSVRHNVNSVRTNVNTGRSKQPVPTCNSNSFSPVRPQVNKFNQRSHFSKSHSPVRRPIVRNTARMTYSHAVKGNWGTAVKTSAGYNWRRPRPNSNYNSGSNFVRTVNVKGPQGRPKPEKAWNAKGDLLPLEVAKATLLNQMLDYGFNFMNTKIHIDNESTICIVKNPVYHSKTKHIEIRHHFIRDSYEKKLIRVEKIHTDFNVADLLTKAFDGPRFNFLVVNIGTLQTPNENVFEEEDEVEELIIVPTALQNHKTQEKEAYSTVISEDTPKILAFRRELDELAQKHLREVPKNKATSTNSVNSGSGQDNTQPADQDDSDMPELTIFNKPQKGIFDEASYDDEGMVYDFNNLPTESSVQTRSRVQQHPGAHEEPKKISEALKDDSWVEAMQEELLQFRLQQVWILVDLPYGAKVIGTKWVYINKRDERGVVVRNKARLLVPSCFAIFTFKPLTLSLTSMPSCDLESLTNILILCLILKASNQSLRKSLSLNLELS
ncbi:hypothetical protein Tco_1232431 [Tanacetum coccineum]